MANIIIATSMCCIMLMIHVVANQLERIAKAIEDLKESANE